MVGERYTTLLAELVYIAEKLKLFEECVQPAVYESLVDALFHRDSEFAVHDHAKNESNETIVIGTGGKQIGQRNYATEIDSLYDEYGLEGYNDMELAAFVAYYFTEVAPTDARVESIGPEHFEELCTITGRSLPKNARSTLSNARHKKKYLNGSGKGEFTLSTIGRHYVKHTMLKKVPE